MIRICTNGIKWARLRAHFFMSTYTVHTPIYIADVRSKKVSKCAAEAEMSTKLWGCQRNVINHSYFVYLWIIQRFCPLYLATRGTTPSQFATRFSRWPLRMRRRGSPSMDTHLPERAFSLALSAFILGVPRTRKRNFGGALHILYNRIYS